MEKRFKSSWVLSRIPKICHVYWGNKTLPYLRYLTVASFCKLNPDWEVNFYYPKQTQTEISWLTHEQKYDVSKAEDYYGKLKNLPINMVELDFCELGLANYISEVHKSDFLRWKVLSTTGGLWSDMDIMFFHPMTRLSLNKPENKKMDTLVCYHKPYEYSIGFMLGGKNNEYYSFLWQMSFKDFNPKRYQTIGACLVNKYPIKKLQKKFNSLVIGNITMDTVYAYNTSLITQLYTTNDMSKYTPTSIGLHWYAGHKLAYKYVNSITEKTYKDYDNTLCKTVSIVLKKMVDK